MRAVERIPQRTGSIAAEIRVPAMQRLLVANRGEIALRIFRACLAEGIETVAVVASDDRGSLHARAAGVPVLPTGAPEEIGFPLLVKAAAGGGGRGMRIVRTPEELDDAVEAARREAEGAFGDDTVFFERYLERPRHVEIQVLADRYGSVIALGERECSVQRRHQKVLEESPSAAVDPE